MQEDIREQRAYDPSHAIANFVWDRIVPYHRALYQKR
jgi:hypothetical protein